MLCRAMSAMLGYPDFRSYGWQWRLWCTMRYFLCSNSVRVMLLKVWQNNRRDMSLQRNCVAVMLLKARGWRGTSLPRGSGNVWFSNPVRVLFFPNYVEDKKKLNPFRVHFMRPFNPHVGSLRSPTWGFQTHNSYRVANMGNDNTYYKYKAFKRTTRTELRIWETTTRITNIRLSGVQLIHYNIISPYIPLLYKTFKNTTRTELPFYLSPVILPHRHYDETTGWRLPHDRV